MLHVLHSRKYEVDEGAKFSRQGDQEDLLKCGTAEVKQESVHGETTDDR